MDADKAKERVLVIPEARFKAAGIFHGFRPYSESYLRTHSRPRIPVVSAAGRGRDRSGLQAAHTVCDIALPG